MPFLKSWFFSPHFFKKGICLSNPLFFYLPIIRIVTSQGIRVLHNFQNQKQNNFLYRAILFIYITSAVSFFHFLAERNGNGHSSSIYPMAGVLLSVLYMFSLNPQSNPMRKAVLSTFYSSGNPSSRRISNLPWVTQPLDAL